MLALLHEPAPDLVESVAKEPPPCPKREWCPTANSVKYFATLDVLELVKERA
jgi:hypothetical protein